ncbi:MAG: FliM/FliN family flagellar motor switch protein [Rhodomicrobiaceae bacterium]
MLDTAGAGSSKPSYNGSAPRAEWQPAVLREVNPDFVEAVNALYRRRPSRRSQLAGRSLTFKPVWRRTLPIVPEAWTLTLDIDGEPAELICPQVLVDSLFKDIEASIDREALSPDIQALLLEFVLSDTLEKIETVLGSFVSLHSAHKGLATWIGYDYPVLAIEIELEGAAKSWSTLRASHRHLQRLAQGLDWLPGVQRAAPVLDLPMPVNLRLACVDLSFAEVKTLQAGDIVLVDAHCREPETAIAVIGESLVAPVKILPTGYQLLDLPKPATGSALDWCVDPPAGRLGPLSEGGAMDVPIRVFVELGRFELSLAALPELTRGAQIGANALPGAWLDLMAAGTLIGHGEVTAVGGSFGVRIVRA